MKVMGFFIKLFAVISLLSIIVFTSGCVTTEKDIDPLHSDIQTLRLQLTKTQEDLTNLRQDMAKETEKQLAAMKEELDAIQKNQADSKVQMDKMGQDVSIANNRLDDYRDRLDKLDQRITASEQSLNQKLDVAKTEIQRRLDILEQKVNSNSAMTPTLGEQTGQTAMSGSSTNTAPVEIVDPKQLYQTAEQDYLKGQYELSQKESQDYLSRFTTGAELASARFLLAENYLAQQKFDDALAELNTFIQTYPNDDKVPTAMLKRAFIYKQLKKSDEQQDELKAIVKKYPLSAEAEQALEELKSTGK